MLQDILRAKGLVLEGEELPAEPVENVQIDEQALGQEIEEVHADAGEIIASDEAVTSLESLVATLESCGGAKTALEKHLAMTQAALLYKTIGLAAPAVASLESADSVELSLESWKDTALKVIAAIKAAWAKLVAALSALWGRLMNGVKALKLKIRVRITSSKKETVSLAVPDAGDGESGDAYVTKHEEAVKVDVASITSASEEFYKAAEADVAAFARFYSVDAVSIENAPEFKILAEGEKLIQGVSLSRTEVAPEAKSSSGGDGAKKVKTVVVTNVKKAGEQIVAGLDAIDKWHQEWHAKHQIVDKSIKAIEDTIKKVSDKAGEANAAIQQKAIATGNKLSAAIRKGKVKISEAAANVTQKTISLANRFSYALDV